MSMFTERRAHHIEACAIHGRVPYVDRMIDALVNLGIAGGNQQRRLMASYNLDAPETIPEPGISGIYANTYQREWLCE